MPDDRRVRVAAEALRDYGDEEDLIGWDDEHAAARVLARVDADDAEVRRVPPYMEEWTGRGNYVLYRMIPEGDHTVMLYEESGDQHGDRDHFNDPIYGPQEGGDDAS